MRLSLEGRKALEGLNALGWTLAETKSVEGMAPEVAASRDEAVGLVEALPDEDRELIAQIFQLKGRAYDQSTRENMEAAEQARLAEDMLARLSP